MSLVSFAPILSSPVFPDSSLGLSELPTSQRGPSNLLSSTILDPIFDNAVINESPDCVSPVSALLPPSAGDVSTEVSPSINADSSPWGPPGFRPSWGLPSMVDVLERLIGIVANTLCHPPNSQFLLQMCLTLDMRVNFLSLKNDLRRKGEGFEQRGGGFSSGYENSDGMQDGSSGLREFSSAVDNGELVSSPHNGIENGELDNGEHVSSPHNGIDDGKHVPLASEQSSSSIDDGEHVHLSCHCFENFCVNNLIFFSSSSARSRVFSLSRRLV